MDGAIQRRKLSDEVLDRLLHMLESGALPPGSQLPSERDLMSRFKVGRPAVREAMQSLERMGLIEISHGERARVNELSPRSMFVQIDRTARHLLSSSPETLEHLKEARLLFEVGIVRRAAERPSSEDLKRLREMLARQEAAMDRPDEFVAADIAFHNVIASMSGNPLLTAVSEAMLQWLFEFHQELLRLPDHEDVTYSEHKLIYECIAARAPDRAAKAMIDHLTRASVLYRKPGRDGGPSKANSTSER